jgi:parallel beta-helix repeat protein
LAELGVEFELKQTKAVFLTLLPLLNMLLVPAFYAQATGLIFIRPDGSIEGTNKIHRNGNTYVFSGDIEESYGIIVEKSNIVIDGQGHTLKATPRFLPIGSWDFGIELSNVTRGNVTIKNLRIVDFNIGVYIWTVDNTIEGNTIIGGNVGVFLAESPNTVVGNYIENNGEGIFLGPLHDTHPVVFNLIYKNSFVNNTRQVYDCECTDPHTIQHKNIWDNGAVGNYWNNYNGTDNNKDGIGDTPYAVSEDDNDVYPLMSPLVHAINNSGFLGTSIPFEYGLAFTVITAVAVLVTVYLALKHKKHKKV